MGKSLPKAAKNTYRICYHLGKNIKRLTIKDCFFPSLKQFLMSRSPLEAATEKTEFAIPKNHEEIKNLLSPRNLPEETENERNLLFAWITTSDGQEPP